MTAQLTAFLKQMRIGEFCVAEDEAKAIRLAGQRQIDFVIVCSPVAEAFGDYAALQISQCELTQVIMLVPASTSPQKLDKVQNAGVFVLEKPLNPRLFWNILKVADGVQKKISRLTNKNKELAEQIEIIKLVERAKLSLIEKEGMSEEDAHKYIERSAMDNRITKKEAASRILERNSRALAITATRHDNNIF
jgi:response regulator NasT